MLNPTRISMPGAETPGASCERTRREQESQEDRETRLGRQRIRTNHLTPRQRWVPQLVFYIFLYIIYNYRLLSFQTSTEELWS